MSKRNLAKHLSIQKSVAIIRKLTNYKVPGAADVHTLGDLHGNNSASDGSSKPSVMEVERP